MHSKREMGSDGDIDALAALVADAEDVSDAARTVQIREVRMLAAAGQLAKEQAAGASERVKAREMALRGIAAELAGVLVLTDRTVQRRIDDACDLVENYPVTFAAWEAGRITRGHVRVIQDVGCIVPVGEREEFEDVAVQRCEGETPNRVRDGLRMLAERMHPRSFTERHKEAAAGRCVQVFPGVDGMSNLVATLPTALADGIADRLTQQAREIIHARPRVDAAAQDAAAVQDAAAAGVNPGTAVGAQADADGAACGIDGEATTTHGLFSATGELSSATGELSSATGELSEPTDTAQSSFVGDTRTIDQVRADVFTDLLLVGAPSLDPTDTGDGNGALGAIRAKVQVVVSALTLTGRDEEPADLVGHSPIDAATARALAGNNTAWERLLTHPVTGTVLECDAYEPTAAMKRLLRARDRHCRFPGCRQPAIRCERDHTIAVTDGGPTHICNLAHLCKRHHDVKHHTRWQVRQLPGGRLIWTSPTGRVYREDAPPPLVAFSIEPGGAPPPPPPPDGISAPRLFAAPPDSTPPF